MPKKIIKRKITLEDVGKGLQDLSERMDARFNEINDSLGRRIENTHLRIDSLREHMDRRFDEQTNDFSIQITDVLEVVDERCNRLEERTDRLESKVNGVETGIRTIENGIKKIELFTFKKIESIEHDIIDVRTKLSKAGIA